MRRHADAAQRYGPRQELYNGAHVVVRVEGEDAGKCADDRREVRGCASQFVHEDLEVSRDPPLGPLRRSEPRGPLRLALQRAIRLRVVSQVLRHRTRVLIRGHGHERHQRSHATRGVGPVVVVVVVVVGFRD